MHISDGVAHKPKVFQWLAQSEKDVEQCRMVNDAPSCTAWHYGPGNM